MKKNGFAVIIFFLVMIIGFWACHQNQDAKSSTNRNLFRDTTHLIFTKHAKCRMDCRHVNKREIIEIIVTGNVNYSKSGRGGKGDETYSLEGYSYEHQHLRVVVAPESDGLVVITCIDLDKEWPCNCY
jgi:hypothetical protein